MEIAALGGKQYLDPFLYFDELTLSIIALRNATLALMDVDFNYAFGLLVLQVPWMILLWFFFDGEFDNKNMFNE